MNEKLKRQIEYVFQRVGAIEDSSVILGEEITLPEGTLLGHGIVSEAAKVSPSSEMADEPGLARTAHYAAMTGELMTVNSLAYVTPLNARYIPAIGDVVIGRVVEVAQGRWTIDINASHLGKLMLSSVALPTGEQRRKTDAEVINMRRFFSEDDLVFTEVQKVNNDRTCNLHTRNARYGRLYNGCVVSVPAPLVKRLSQHSFVFGDVYVVLGSNGSVWIGSRPECDSTDTLNFVQSRDNKYLPINTDLRQRIARVRNSILLLSKLSLIISPDSIISVYNASVNLAMSDLLKDKNALPILRQCLLTPPTT